MNTANSLSYVVGIDVGTTSIKGMLVSDNGQIVAFAKQEYALETEGRDICELDAEMYWNVTCQIIHRLVADADANRITGISFSSQGETLIVVDKEGKPLRKAIVWLDNRATIEAEEVKVHFGEQRVMDITGQAEVIPNVTANFVRWLRKNEPDTFKKAEKILLVEDFLIYRLTGVFATEPSVSSSTLYLDISERKWWTEMLDFIGITEKQLPKLYASGEVIGTLTSEAAAATGLCEATRCVAGSYDHPAGAIGSGNIRVGDATLTIGASMAMCIALDKPVFDRSLHLPCQCHSLPGMYMLQPYEPTAGMVLKWFKDTFAQSETREAAQNNTDVYDLLTKEAESVPAGADGLLMLPHLMGSGSPEFNADARGVFAGITLGMQKGHFVRSIMESICLMIRRNLEAMQQKGIEVSVIHILGGAAKSPLWNQVLADVTGLPVVTLQNTENAVMGACLLAAVETGLFDNIETACQTFVRTDQTFNPDPKNHTLYSEIYKKYVYLYQSLDTYWKL